MSQQVMKECFEQSYSQKWEQAGAQERAVWETAWYASRAVLVVTLPPALEDDLTLIHAIEAAGVQVKP